MFDDNPDTMFIWITYRSERTDYTPEITVEFSGETIGGMGIRNGNLRNETMYYAYARIVKMTVIVYQNNGQTSEFVISIPDTYTRNYQNIKFPKQYTGVYRIEFFTYWNGYDENDQSGIVRGNNGYYTAITDMKFYK